MKKKIPIKVYEELKYVPDLAKGWVVWIDNNGINTPYIVSVVNNG